MDKQQRHMPTRGEITVNGCTMQHGPEWTPESIARSVAIYREINPHAIVAWSPLPCYCNACNA